MWLPRARETISSTSSSRPRYRSAGTLTRQSLLRSGLANEPEEIAPGYDAAVERRDAVDGKLQPRDVVVEAHRCSARHRRRRRIRRWRVAQGRLAEEPPRPPRRHPHSRTMPIAPHATESRTTI